MASLDVVCVKSIRSFSSGVMLGAGASGARPFSNQNSVAPSEYKRLESPQSRRVRLARAPYNRAYPSVGRPWYSRMYRIPIAPAEPIQNPGCEFALAYPTSGCRNRITREVVSTSRGLSVSISNRFASFGCRTQLA